MPQIALSRIVLDQRAQPRATLDTTLTAEYAEAMKAGARFPALKVFHDGKRYYLADGFHRHYAAVSVGFREFDCLVEDGSLRDAILFACQANAAHGRRRSDEDKRRAVETLLADKEWSSWSDREIARRCAVSNTFVSQMRAAQQPAYLSTLTDRHRKVARGGGESYTMQTAQIGQRTASNDSRNPAPMPKPSPAAPKQAAEGDGGAMGAPQHHAAMTFLARSVSEIKASAQQVVDSCENDEARDDLREACEVAVAKLGDVLKALDARGHKRAA